MDLFTIVTARADYELGALVIIDQTTSGTGSLFGVENSEGNLGGHLFVKGKGCACHRGGCRVRDFRVYAKGG